MQGTVVQINLSRGGVPKLPVEEALLTPHGIEGDLQAHPAIHGGILKAVLLICAEAIDDLVARGYPLYYGAMGENLTVAGLDRRLLRSGQRFRVGQALIELTTLRAPCSALERYGADLHKELYDAAVKAGDPSSPCWAMGGFYASVIKSGHVRRRDIITLVEQLA